MDSMLLFAIIFLALAFAIIGLVTEYKIFNLFSSGVFLVLIIELQTYTALVIVFIGLMIYQIWYATFGKA